MTDRALDPRGSSPVAVLDDAVALLAVVRQQVTAQPTAVGLLLTTVEVDQIAAALGLGARPTAVAILAAIDRLASLKIGDIRLPFTPGQLAELQHRASKRGRTVEAEMRAVVARIEDELFYKGS